MDDYQSNSKNYFNQDLDSPITVEEVAQAIKKLKNGKAPGLDGIINEIFKNADEESHKHLCTLYNHIFNNEDFPEQWSRGLIFPLFKGGPDEARVDPNRYRGITLLSIVGKIYTSILNTRLYNWCDNNNILVDEQCGFRKSRSTIDHIFTLTEIIKHRRPKKNLLRISRSYKGI